MGDHDRRAGPTPDDLTRSAVAEVFRLPLEIDAEILASVEGRFRRFGTSACRRPTRSGRGAARRAGSPNRHGTAPGLIVEGGGSTFFVLPGSRPR